MKIVAPKGLEMIQKKQQGTYIPCVIGTHPSAARIPISRCGLNSKSVLILIKTNDEGRRMSHCNSMTEEGMGTEGKWALWRQDSNGLNVDF